MVMIYYSERIQIKNTKGKKLWDIGDLRPGDTKTRHRSWRHQGKLLIVLSQGSLVNGAQFSQQQNMKTHMECHSQGYSHEPWCPDFLLGVSHVGMAYLPHD